MNYIKNRIMLAGLMMLGIAPLACSCSDDNDSSASIETRPTKVTLSLEKYITESGAVQPSWASGDNAPLIVVENPGKIYYASPILPNHSSSLFLFEVEAPATASVVSYYPFDASVKVADRKVSLNIPQSQDGTIKPLLLGHDNNKLLSGYEGCTVALTQYAAIMNVNIQRGNYSVKSIEIASNGGEGIAGDITIDVDSWTPEASANTVNVTLANPIDCTVEGKAVTVMLAPVYLSAGYTIKVTTTDGKQFTTAESEPVNLVSGEKYSSVNTSQNGISQLIVCGSNMVYIVDANQALSSGDYKNAVLWSWDATEIADILGLKVSRCDHIDDCKPVDNATKLLITSSYGWCVLLDKATKEVLFHTTSVPNAHSAELLPNNRIAVACSNGNTENHSTVQLYDINKPNVILQKYALDTAHGVVWDNNTERMFAIGHNLMQIYSLKDWNTDSPSMTLEKTVTLPEGSAHDLTLADSNTLCVAGVKAFLYNIATGSFSEMKLFNNSTQVKSLNYNPASDELWYTDATVPEGDYAWSTHTINYSNNYNASAPSMTFKVNDLNVYKVRVLNW
ncbi:MAG: DUF6528 family protein [Muribaculum sp.]|nr:DUF6528 family protein [Muribaculum sp.]